MRLRTTRLGMAVLTAALLAGSMWTGGAFAGTTVGRDVDCPGRGDNPVSRERAQQILNGDRRDPHELDADRDGIACEAIRVRTARTVQYDDDRLIFVGGVQGGAGGTADGGAGALPFLLSGALGLVAASGALYLLRRQRSE